jgi:glycosyltransferase involved in cell wall biosynthesis
MAEAFQKLGHQTRMASLIQADRYRSNTQRDGSESLWKRYSSRFPLGLELSQIAYNLLGVPLLIWKCLTQRPTFIYERYAPFNISGVLTAWLFRIPIILEVNAPAFEDYTLKTVLRCRLATAIEVRICNFATRVTTVSTPLRRLLVAEGVTADKTVVVPNGVDLEGSDVEDLAGLRTEVGLTDHIVIGFVGRFREWHHLDMLLEAFQHLHRTDRPLALLLVGDGPIKGFFAVSGG